MQRSEEVRRHAWLERRAVHRRKKALVTELKCQPCADCGQSFDPVCMDFHHIDPETKVGTIHVIMVNNTEQKLMEEIDKCVVLCACCHRLRHKG